MIDRLLADDNCTLPVDCRTSPDRGFGFRNRSELEQRWR